MTHHSKRQREFPRGVRQETVGSYGFEALRQVITRRLKANRALVN